MDTATKTHLLDVLNALTAREAGNARRYGRSTDQQFEDHLDYGLSMGETPAWATEERELRKRGQEYFAQGYRLRYGPRRVLGIGFGDVLRDDKILLFRRIFAGHIGTAEAEQLQYIIKI